MRRRRRTPPAPPAAVVVTAQPRAGAPLSQPGRAARRPALGARFTRSAGGPGRLAPPPPPTRAPGPRPPDPRATGLRSPRPPGATPGPAKPGTAGHHSAGHHSGPAGYIPQFKAPRPPQDKSPYHYGDLPIHNGPALASPHIHHRRLTGLSMARPLQSGLGAAGLGHCPRTALTPPQASLPSHTGGPGQSWLIPADFWPILDYFGLFKTKSWLIPVDISSYLHSLSVSAQTWGRNGSKKNRVQEFLGLCFFQH